MLRVHSLVWQWVVMKSIAFFYDLQVFVFIVQMKRMSNNEYYIYNSMKPRIRGFTTEFVSNKWKLGILVYALMYDFNCKTQYRWIISVRFTYCAYSKITKQILRKCFLLSFHDCFKNYCLFTLYNLNATEFNLKYLTLVINMCIFIWKRNYLICIKIIKLSICGTEEEWVDTQYRIVWK